MQLDSLLENSFIIHSYLNKKTKIKGNLTLYLLCSIAIIQIPDNENLTFVVFIQSIMQPGTDFLFFPTRVLYLQLGFIFNGNASFTLKWNIFVC